MYKYCIKPLVFFSAGYLVCKSVEDVFGNSIPSCFGFNKFSNDLKWKFLKNNPNFIMHLNKPTEMMCKYSWQKDQKLINFMKNVNPNVYLGYYDSGLRIRSPHDEPIDPNKNYFLWISPDDDSNQIQKDVSSCNRYGSDGLHGSDGLQ